MKHGTKTFHALQLLAGITLLSIFSVTNAQEKRPVVKSIEVRYVGKKTLSEERILARMGTRPGDKLSMRQLDEDVKNLLKSGEVSNVRMLSNDVPGGIAIIAVVESRPLYAGARFEGNKAFSDRKLGKMVECKVNQPINDSAIRTARMEIQTAYRKKGYADCTVNYQVTSPNAQGYSQVVFRIDEKNPGILRKVAFSGNRSITADEIKEAMTQKEKSLENVFKGWGRTDADSIANDVEAIEQLYRNRGFFYARVVNVEKVPVDQKYNDLIFTIEEGQGHNLSKVEVNGIKAIDFDTEIAPFLKTQSGKSFSAADIKEDIQMIERIYRSKGYVDVQVNPVIE